MPACQPHAVTICLWWLTDPDFGRPHRTRYKLSAEEARAIDPEARAVPGTSETRLMWPTTAAAEALQWMSTGHQPAPLDDV